MKKVFVLIFIFLILTAVFLTGFILFNKNEKNEKKIVVLINNSQNQICQSNEDCVPKEVLADIRYFCKEQKCSEEILTNPASINCQEKGGRLNIRQDFRNQEYRVCVFQDGSECEEWKFFKVECEQGDFYLSDNIWDGKIISLRGAKFDDYFEMLNGDKIGITGIDQETSEILEILRGKEFVIKVSGEILNTADDVSGKRLIVNKIVDMGDFKFKKISEEESLKIAKEAIEASSEYLDNKGVNLLLVKTIKQSAPYFWIFHFSYSDFSGLEKEVEVRIQEGEVKDIIAIKKIKEELCNCDEFAFAKICSKDYNPVCAKIEKNNYEINPKSLLIDENLIVRWKIFTNACVACLYFSETEKVIGYKTGECNDNLFE